MFIAHKNIYIYSPEGILGEPSVEHLPDYNIHLFKSTRSENNNIHYTFSSEQDAKNFYDDVKQSIALLSRAADNPPNPTLVKDTVVLPKALAAFLEVHGKNAAAALAKKADLELSSTSNWKSKSEFKAKPLHISGNKDKEDLRKMEENIAKARLPVKESAALYGDFFIHFGLSYDKTNKVVTAQKDFDTEWIDSAPPYVILKTMRDCINKLKKIDREAASAFEDKFREQAFANNMGVKYPTDSKELKALDCIIASDRFNMLLITNKACAKAAAFFVGLMTAMYAACGNSIKGPREYNAILETKPEAKAKTMRKEKEEAKAESIRKEEIAYDIKSLVDGDASDNGLWNIRSEVLALFQSTGEKTRPICLVYADDNKNEKEHCQTLKAKLAQGAFAKDEGLIRIISKKEAKEEGIAVDSSFAPETTRQTFGP